MFPSRNLRAGRLSAAGLLVVVLLRVDCFYCTPIQHLKGTSALVLPSADEGRTIESKSEAASSVQLLQPDHAVHFQVIGDWGRQGLWNQSEVAEVMAAAAEWVPPHFIISTGDNFYHSGLTSVNDSNFAASFQEVYHQPQLQVPWYAVLGNHDYGDGIAAGQPPPDCPPHSAPWDCSAGPLTQLSASLRERDGRWNCRRSRVLSLAGGAVDVFMYDTTPFVQYYYARTWAANAGGINEQSWQSNLAELDAALAASAASWKIVVGHHPVRSNGEEHGDTPELGRYVQPLLAKYGVQLYLAGHDHDLEHIKAAGEATHHIVSGAGSQTRRMGGSTDAVFQHGMQGFVGITIRQEVLEASFFGLEGEQPMHVAVIPRSAEAAGSSSGGSSSDSSVSSGAAEVSTTPHSTAGSSGCSGGTPDVDGDCGDDADQTAQAVWESDHVVSQGYQALHHDQQPQQEAEEGTEAAALLDVDW